MSMDFQKNTIVISALYGRSENETAALFRFFGKGKVNGFFSKIYRDEIEIGVVLNNPDDPNNTLANLVGGIIFKPDGKIDVRWWK